MSSYLNYKQSIIDAGVLEAPKRIGLNPTIFDNEMMSQHYADHQWIVFENAVEDRKMRRVVGRMSQSTEEAGKYSVNPCSRRLNLIFLSDGRRSRFQ